MKPRWTTNELKELIKLFNEGKSVDEIADILPGRGSGGIYHKLVTLGLIVPRKKPMLKPIRYKTYEIYSEGYRATCEVGHAGFVGSERALTFKDACKKHFKGDSLYDQERNAYWGCQLFDNLRDAQESFG